MKRDARSTSHSVVFLLVCGLLASATAGAQSLNSAVLPTSRSVQVGVTATAFATIVVSGGTATQCSITPDTALPIDFLYQTTDASNLPTGTPNTPVDIPTSQSFVIGLTPNGPFDPTEIEFTFDCANTDPAPLFQGVNTLLLSASTTPVPDVIGLALTPSADGNVSIVGSNASAFSVAAVNVGSGGQIDVVADTGLVNLPLILSLCETDPSDAACINPTQPGAGPIGTTIAADGTATFSIFASATDDIPFDPANSRISVRFLDSGGVTRGSTSVSVEALTQALSLLWEPPTKNTDGTDLVDLAGFKLYWGNATRSYTGNVEINDMNATSYVVALPTGTYYFALTAFDVDGNESAFSNEAVGTI
jgi:hypothetical protein